MRTTGTGPRLVWAVAFLGFVLVMVSLHTGQAGWAWAAAGIDAVAAAVLLLRVGSP